MDKTILIVDDARFMRERIKEIVTKENYKVIGEADNGIVGVNMYKKLKPDLVTLDLDMPVMNGFEAMEEILFIDPDATILVITGDYSKEAKEKALNIGAIDIFTKPFQPEHLLDKIRKILNNRNQNKKGVDSNKNCVDNKKIKNEDEFDLSQSDSNISEDEFDLSQNDSNIDENEFDLSQNDSNVSEDEFDLSQSDSNISEDEFDLSQNDSNIDSSKLIDDFSSFYSIDLEATDPDKDKPKPIRTGIPKLARLGGVVEQKTAIEKIETDKSLSELEISIKPPKREFKTNNMQKRFQKPQNIIEEPLLNIRKTDKEKVRNNSLLSKIKKIFIK